MQNLYELERMIVERPAAALANAERQRLAALAVAGRRPRLMLRCRLRDVLAAAGFPIRRCSAVPCGGWIGSVRLPRGG